MEDRIELDLEAAKETFDGFQDKHRRRKRYGAAVARALTAAHAQQTKVAERVDIDTLDRLHEAGIAMPGGSAGSKTSRFVFGSRTPAGLSGLCGTPGGYAGRPAGAGKIKNPAGMGAGGIQPATQIEDWGT